MIPHSAENLYDLVKDVRRYPEFIQWIDRLKVSDETVIDGEYGARAIADVSFKGFDERFTTFITASEGRRRIEVTLDRGPFRHLRNRWQFDPQAGNRTRVHFFIDYEFKNPILGLIARTNTRLAIDLIVKAFRAEADRRYTPAGPISEP